MNELLQKLSSYNIFNYLFPGAVFAYLVQLFTDYDLLQDDLVVALFLYYFIGLVISRVGSLIVEPLLKWLRFAPHTKYEDYIAASEKDELIAVLSEQNNMYRTIVALVLSLAAVVAYAHLTKACPVISEYETVIALVLLGLLFLFSYKKQTGYITKRVNSRINRND